MQDHLRQCVYDLNGQVENSKSLSTSVTHLVIPPNMRTVKSIGAGLMGKPVLPPQWVIDSHEAKDFIHEGRYGANTSSHGVFRGKVFFIAESFKHQWGSVEPDKVIRMATTLIVKWSTRPALGHIHTPHTQYVYMNHIRTKRNTHISTHVQW